VYRILLLTEEKVKLSLHYAKKVYGGEDVYIHTFLTSTIVGDEWSVSRSGRFTPPGKEAPVPTG
jgi:hypothetical protein